MSALPKRIMTEDEYLAFERASETKHEYIVGEVFDFAGASPRHSRLATKVAVLLNPAAEAGGCATYDSDLRIRAGQAGTYFYPDLSIICGEVETDPKDRSVAVNPLILVEVLSASTEKFDRGLKFFYYQQLESLQHYLLIAQDRVSVELFSRQPDGSWRYDACTSLDQRLSIPGINATLSLADLYRGVSLGPEGED